MTIWVKRKKSISDSNEIQEVNEDALSLKKEEQRINPSSPGEVGVLKRAKLLKAMLEHGFSQEEIDEYFAREVAEKNLDELIGKKATIVSLKTPSGTIGKEYAMKTGEIVGYSDYDGSVALQLNEPVYEEGDRFRTDAVMAPVENLKIED